MAKGIRQGTLERVVAARELHPLSLGPYIGELATRANITASMVASIVGAHEQTVFRWFFGYGDVQPVWGLKVARLTSLLAWMHATKRAPLFGTLEERKSLLMHHAAEYGSLAVSGETLRTVA